jgi:hypothetical protein
MRALPSQKRCRAIGNICKAGLILSVMSTSAGDWNNS